VDCSGNFSVFSYMKSTEIGREKKKKEFTASGSLRVLEETEGYVIGEED